MAIVNLYIDTVNNVLLQSLFSSQVKQSSSLKLFYGDSPLVNVYLLAPNPANTNPSSSQNPYQNIGTAGLSFFMYLDNGIQSASVDYLLYTQQVSWTATVDSAGNQIFQARLACNTSALETLMGNLASNQSAYLQCGFIDASGLPATVFSDLITVKVGLPNISVAPVPAGLTPLSLEAANQLFVPVAGKAGQGFTQQSPNGKKFLIQVTDNPDGTGSWGGSPLN